MLAVSFSGFDPKRSFGGRSVCSRFQAVNDGRLGLNLTTSSAKKHKAVAAGHRTENCENAQTQ